MKTFIRIAIGIGKSINLMPL